jgi:nucleotide-binding universal stress UspA family protein
MIDTVRLGGRPMKKTAIQRWTSPDIILVATNLFDTPRLVPHAIAQAKITGARVLLVHILEFSLRRPHRTEGLSFFSRNPTLRSAQHKLDRIRKDLKREGVVCDAYVVEGSPAKELAALVREREIDQVILGTHSHTALGRVFLGSVADGLLDALEVPIYVVGPLVGPPPSPGQQPKSILFATSLHCEVGLSAQFAFELAAVSQSRLTLLHVIRVGNGSPEVHSQKRELRKSKLLDLLKVNSELHFPVATEIREGSPAEAIVAAAKEVAADLILLGASSSSKASRLLCPAVAHRVISESTVPVLTIRQIPEHSGVDVRCAAVAANPSGPRRRSISGDPTDFSYAAVHLPRNKRTRTA